MSRIAERRLPLDALERKVVLLSLSKPDADSEAVLHAVRYALSFARLTVVRNADGQDVDLTGPLALHSQRVVEALGPAIQNADSLWSVVRVLPGVLDRTRTSRASVLEHLPLDRDSLEAEVTTRALAVASGGGGGAGYVYPGCYEILERSGLVPDFMAGTSIGSLMSLFRARRRGYDSAALVAAARRLSWSGVFKVLQTENRYGLPATLRLFLRSALGTLFLRPDGEATRLSDMEIPLAVVATGITADALKHDLAYYEHLLDDDVSKPGLRAGVRSGMTALSTLREFFSNRDALVEVVLGVDEGTEDFDALDAAGFSSAVPGVIHYDVLRDDPRMKRILDNLYALRGITRLGEGGLVSNVPAHVCWEQAMAGKIANGRRNTFVLGLDCFSPNPRRIAWFPMQQMVRTANVEYDRGFCDAYVPFPKTLSPMNLVPTIKDSLGSMRVGGDELRPHMPFVRKMCSPIQVL